MKTLLGVVCFLAICPGLRGQLPDPLDGTKNTRTQEKKQSKSDLELFDIGTDFGKQKPRKVFPYQGPQALQDRLNVTDDQELIKITFHLAVWVIVFGALTIIGIGFLAWRGVIRENSTIKLMSLIFLATLASFLIIGGFTPSQIGTAMTLLGTLAGYIFGQRQSGEPAASETARNPVPPTPPPNQPTVP